MTCPRLKHAKGSLAGTMLNDKIFAIGGGDGSAVFSEVEMFDPALGRWIDSVSMRQNVWCQSLSPYHICCLVFSRVFQTYLQCDVISGLYYLSTLIFNKVQDP